MDARSLLPDALLRGAVHELRGLPAIARSGVLRPVRPDRAVGAAVALARHGATVAALAGTGAARFGDDVAIVDERGALSYVELDRRTDALAHGLAGLGAEGGVGILCRNHRGALEALLAASKLGVDAVLLNTGSAAPQLAAVCAREGIGTLVFDDELRGLVAEALEGRVGVVAWEEGRAGEPTLEGLIAAAPPGRPPRPGSTGRVVLLTSGTTGTPKGAAREAPTRGSAHVGLGPGLAGALLEKLPLRTRERAHVAAPVFHALGIAHALASLALGGTLVLRRRFDPEGALEAVASERCEVLVLAPIMLQRILDLPEEVRARHDVGSLRLVHATGSAMGAPLARRALAAFGDVVHSLYGSTEVSWVTIATPADLRADPGCAGRPPRGTRLRLLDAEDREVGPGEIGRIFVDNGLPFAGYTDGTGKAVVDGFVSTGDVGHLDAAGRLTVDGRDDEMIVSGGENVFPREVEELLAGLPEVADVAVVGAPDPEWGQRLRAVLVLREGAELSPDDVRDHVRGELARYKVPRDVVFVAELPRNATGKVLKREL